MQEKTFPQKRRARSTAQLLQYMHSFRLRLTLWYLLILATILCIFSVAIYLTEKQALYQDLNTNMQTNIQQIPAIYNPQQNRLLENNGVPQMLDSIVILLNPQGQIIQSSDIPITHSLRQLAKLLSESPGDTNSQAGFSYSYTASSNLYFSTSGGPHIEHVSAGPWRQYAFEVVTITNQQKQVLNRVLLGLHTDLPDQLTHLQSILAVIAPLILLISSIGGYWLASRAIRPVQTITRTAQEISGMDLHRRLNLRRHDELGELAATFDKMLERLEQAFERQRQFTADASHELRTPLTIVNTEVERMLQREHSVQEYNQTLNVVQQENQRMTRLVSDLLTLARTDTGQGKLKCEQVDLSEIIVDVVEHLACQVEQNGIEVRLSGLDEIQVWGDQLYLTQLCTNLLDNAIKYGAGIDKHIDVELSRQQKQARIRFIDKGPGIAAEHLLHLFERFYRVDQVRTYNQSSGSGLGLAIAQRIAQTHGGSIQVQSQPGQGSIFEVYLPL